jgi:acetyl esterase/lipase
MSPITSCAPLVALLSLGAPAMGANPPLVLDVWPGGKALNDYGQIGEERVRPPDDAPTKDAKWITNVTHPTISVFRPPKEKNTGVAMVICPGGGYWNLAWDLEGEEVAAWLNSAGITGIVLKYRVPRRPTQPVPLPPPGPLMDAQRALSLVRSHSAEWEIDPNRIGIVGFSAGGHLALAAATGNETRTYETVDSVDRASCRPDFAVAVYSGYLVRKETGLLSEHVMIRARTPPVFLVHAGDDTMADAENSVGMYLALKRVGIPAELHIYAKGEHGFGVRKKGIPTDAWTDACISWLRGLGMLKPGVGR